MNGTLLEKLEQYFYNGDYNEQPDSVDLANRHGKVTELCEALGLDYTRYCELEGAIADIGVESELQGFLRGYEYCLTMIGLANGGKENA